MKRNSPKRVTQLIEAFEHDLGSILPRGWSLQPERPGHDQGTDVVIYIDGPGGSSGVMAVQVKHFIEPRHARWTAEQLKESADRLARDHNSPVATLLVANFISERTREVLRESGIGWYDPTGNIRVLTEQPAILIERSGSNRDPFTQPSDRRLKSLKGAGAARVVRGLLDHLGPIGIREVAAIAETSLATSSRTVDLLDRQSLVERNANGSILRVHKTPLVRAWTRDYRMTTSNRATTALAPRGLDWLTAQLADKRLPHTLTGSAALRRHLPEGSAAVAPLAMLTIYSDEIPLLLQQLRLREVERGANVILLEPFDHVVLRDAIELDGNRYTAASQTVADLLTSPGRGPQEAEQLIEHLARQDEGWML